MPPMSPPSTSRLPGFLRRSLRISYDEGEDDEDNDEEEEKEEGEGQGGAEQADGDGDGGKKREETIGAAGGGDGGGSAKRDGEEGSSSAPVGSMPAAAAAAAPRQRLARSVPSNAYSDAPNAAAAPPPASSPPAAASTLSGAPGPSDATLPVPPPHPPLAPGAKLTWREAQFNKCLEAEVVSLAELRKLAWNGIPGRHRALAWKLLLGYVPTNRQRRDATLARKRSEYKNTVAAQHFHDNDHVRTPQDQETLRQVLVDVPRTAPDVPLFRHDRIKRLLTRLLYSWAMRHPASSYVQGINDLATPLVVVFLGSYLPHHEDDDQGGQQEQHLHVLDGHVMNHLSDACLEELEADVYWCLTNLLSSIQDHYTADQPGVQRMVRRLEDLTNRIDSALCQHLRSEGVEFLQFSFKWMNCLLLREFQLGSVPRLWDTYIAERSGFEDFHVYVCAAFLCQFSSELQTMSFDALFGFFQQMPTESWTDTEIEMLLSQAYVLSTLFGGSDAHLANNTHSTLASNGNL